MPPQMLKLFYNVSFCMNYNLANLISQVGYKKHGEDTTALKKVIFL